MSTARFRWRAATDAGELRDGVLAASDAQGVIDALRREHLHPVEVAPLQAPRAIAWGGRSSRTSTAAAWVRTLATLLGGGVTLDRALGVAAREARHPTVAGAAGDVASRVRGGATLADAMADHSRVFPATVVAMVRAGERGGALVDALARAAAWSDERDAVQSELRAQLLYPAVMAIAAVFGTSVILLAVIPRFVAMLGDLGGAPPWSTRVLMATSAVVTHGWWAALLLVAALAVAGARWVRLPDNRRRLHAVRLAVPVVGVWERERATAQWAGTVGALLQGGVPLLTALRIAPAGESNAELAAQLARVADRVARGDRLAASLDDVLPATAVQLVAAGEESGRLDELCQRVSASYGASAKRTLRALVALVEPATVLGFGAVVGFVALGMLQAIYSVNGMVMR